jgi:hypothetical protein
MSTAGARGGTSAAGDEEMEDQVETEQDSTSHVAMGRGTFIAGTGDGLGTVTKARHSAKRHRAAVNVSQDLLNRLIQDYGLVSPERVKNVVWFFFKKFGSKKLNGQDALLKLAQQALCTICLVDQERRRYCTVKFGKDVSPSSMIDHMRINHQDEFNAVAVANDKGTTLAAFTVARQPPRVCVLIGNSSVCESADNSRGTPNATPNAGATAVRLHQGAGTVFHT